MIAYELPSELLARCAGQPEIGKRVLERYVEQMRDDVPRLLELLNAGDTDAASKLAHRIKGASANVAAEQLRHLGAEAERHAEDGQLQTATAIAQDLSLAWPSFEELTHSFLQS